MGIKGHISLSAMLYIFVGLASFGIGGLLFKPDNSWLVLLGVAIVILIAMIGISEVRKDEREYQEKIHQANRIIESLEKKAHE